MAIGDRLATDKPERVYGKKVQMNVEKQEADRAEIKKECDASRATAVATEKGIYDLACATFAE